MQNKLRKIRETLTMGTPKLLIIAFTGRLHLTSEFLQIYFARLYSRQEI